MFQKLRNELSKNDGVKSKYVVLSYRIANYTSRSNLLIRLLLLFFSLQYKLFVEMIFGVEIPCNVTIGWGMKISHAKCITVHPNTVIGTNVHLRHGVTIGNKSSGSNEVPIIGNDVDIGCFSTILGRVDVGNNTIIGAHTLLLKTTQQYAIAMGIPAKITNCD